MQDAVNFNNFRSDAINNNKRKAGNDQFTRSCLAAWPTTMGKSAERTHSFYNCKRDPA